MPDVAALAGANEIVERLESFMMRRLRIRLMNLVQVDIVGAQSFKARLRGRHDVAVRSSLQIRTVAHRHAELGRNDSFATTIAERFAQQLFGAAAIAVNVGGVEQPDTFVDRLI